MDITISPGPLKGDIRIIPSKSYAHRMLICATFAEQPTDLICSDVSLDIEATADCLRALGCGISRTETGYSVIPFRDLSEEMLVNCHESGSTLRFLLPIVGALGVKTIFKMEGRLPQRPLSPLWEEMERMGCSLEWLNDGELLVEGKLRPGDYYLDGAVSSQFISGLLMAAPLMGGDTTIHIKGKLESAPYVEMTRKAMAFFGVKTEGLHVKEGQPYLSPGKVTVEGDWSAGAVMLAADYLGSEVDIYGLDMNSVQGDRAIMGLLPQLKEKSMTISVADTPDLVPILAIVVAQFHGAEFTDIRRLRLKESDRVATTIAMIEALGGKAEADEYSMKIYGTGLTGGTVDAAGDHRIAMAAAIGATVCSEAVTILGAECVSKSWPRFWEEFAQLGGKYELNIR